MKLSRPYSVMYERGMKKAVPFPPGLRPPDVMQDHPKPSSGGVVNGDAAMVRTQIYLTRSEHEFVTAEALRRGEPMAAVIRGYIDDKMRLPDAAWESNPMLDATPHDPDLALPEDAAINHDHYLYGSPKRYLKKRGRWVLAKEGAAR